MECTTKVRQNYIYMQNAEVSPFIEFEHSFALGGFASLAASVEKSVQSCINSHELENLRLFMRSVHEFVYRDKA